MLGTKTRKPKAVRRTFYWLCRKCGRQWREPILCDESSECKLDASSESICEECVDAIGRLAIANVLRPIIL